MEKGWNSKACEEACLRDCSCTAYASISVAGKSRVCLTWYGELIDTVGYNHGGADLYVWVYAFDLGTPSPCFSFTFSGQTMRLKVELKHSNLFLKDMNVCHRRGNLKEKKKEKKAHFFLKKT